MSKSICTDCAKRARCNAADFRDGELGIGACYLYKKGKPSRGDKIRAMADEELAEFLAEYRCARKASRCMEANCAQCWLDWLRREVEADAKLD